MSPGLQLGRPGVYLAAPGRAVQGLAAVRLDEAGFVGVALRGPANVPTPVSSWAQYESVFGGMEVTVSGRDRLLPYAIQAFFAQGGRRAWVVRVAAVDGERVPTVEEATARFRLDGTDGPALVAADEGRWGSSLDITLEFRVSATVAAGVLAPTRLQLPAGAGIVVGSLLRLRLGDRSLGLLRWVVGVPDPAHPTRPVELDEDLPDGVAVGTRLTVEVVSGTLLVHDPTEVGRNERIEGVGLHHRHPRYLPSAVTASSSLVRADGTWPDTLAVRPSLDPWTSTCTQQGADRSDAVGWDSFFDAGTATADLLDEGPHRGVDLVGRVPELGLLCVPDLTWRQEPVPDQGPVQRVARRPLRWRAECTCCIPADEGATVPEPAVTVRPWLDGTDDVDLAEIMARQRRVVAVADHYQRFVAMLDVPTGLPTPRITDWRAAFDSTYAAAYHPWLGVTRPETAGRGRAVLVPPSAYAAGITGERERRLGLTRGPANQLALGVVRSADHMDDALLGRLHQLSVNVFAAERDGFRLSSARTLSLEAGYRQLSVRRLMTMLRLTLQRYGEDLLVFEPNTLQLRARLTNAVTDLLRDLHRRGAFSGATEEESFFVRCDDTTNPRQSQELGRLVAEVGVAPSEPLEYLVLRIASDGEGRLLVDELARSGAAANALAPEASLV